MRPLRTRPARLLSTVVAPDKSYSHSLLLPKTSFPLRGDPLVREAAFRQRTCEDLYKWQWENAKGSLFIFLDGPPYANGSLHIGHALNKILKDIINRYHVLLGHRVHYMPGWDCHGLPIENKALEKLRSNHRDVPASEIRQKAKEVAEHEMAVQKEEFREFGIMADWNNKLASFRTMDHDYEIRQLHVFRALVEKGLIYHQHRPVYYSPSSQTALAEAELVYVDHVSSALYVTYECDSNTLPLGIQNALGSHATVKLVIWTTTPWTLPTNMAIAVNHEMDYSLVRRRETGDFLIVGTELLSNLQDILGELDILHTCKGDDLTNVHYVAHFQAQHSPYTRLPVIRSTHVTANSGTGLVHCAPAHGGEDYQAFLNQGLLSRSTDERKQLLCLVGSQGTFCPDLMAASQWLDNAVRERLENKLVLTEGNTEVIKLLEESGHLIKTMDYSHRYPYDWKTNKPVLLIATSQWFADLSQIKADALSVLQSVNFHPNATRTRLESYVRDRSEWCISRQRAWGVPIPALYNERTNEAILTSQSLSHIINILEVKGADYWWNGPVDDFVHPALKVHYSNATWRKGTDTMDVWFDSGSSWTLVADKFADNPCIIKDVNGRKMRMIADVCLEGTDQHRGWFQSLLLTAVGVSSQDEVPILPYHTVITHGFVLDKHGRKMSKSLGNVISPMTILQGGDNLQKDPRYGADVLRLWAATIDYGKDTLLGRELIQQTAETLRKIRNSARFILGNLAAVDPTTLKELPDEISIADRYIMHELYHVERAAKEAYATYQFPQVVTALDRLAKVTLSSFYFDITKDILYADKTNSPRRRTVLWVMHEILQTMNIIMAPILPHLSEEVNDVLKKQWGETNVNSVFRQGWHDIAVEWNNPIIEVKMKHLLSVRDKVLNLLERARSDKLVRSSLEAGVDIILPDNIQDPPKFIETLFKEESYLANLFIVSDAAILDEGSLGAGAPEWSISETMEIEGCDEIINLRVRPAKGYKCPRCWTYTRHQDDKLCHRCISVVAA